MTVTATPEATLLDNLETDLGVSRGVCLVGMMKTRLTRKKLS